MQMPTGHANGGAKEAGSMDAKGQTSNKDLDSQGRAPSKGSIGRAPSKGSINIFGTCSIISEGKWEEKEETTSETQK